MSGRTWDWSDTLSVYDRCISHRLVDWYVTGATASLAHTGDVEQLSLLPQPLGPDVQCTGLTGHVRSASAHCTGIRTLENILPRNIKATFDWSCPMRGRSCIGLRETSAVSVIYAIPQNINTLHEYKVEWYNWPFACCDRATCEQMQCGQQTASSQCHKHGRRTLDDSLWRTRKVKL